MEKIMAWMPSRETAVFDVNDRFCVSDGVKHYVFSRISQIICDLEELAPLERDPSLMVKFHLLPEMQLKNDLGAECQAFFDRQSGRFSIGAKYRLNNTVTRQAWLRFLLVEAICREWPRAERWSAGLNPACTGGRNRGDGLLKKLNGTGSGRKYRRFCRLCDRKAGLACSGGKDGLCTLCYGRVKAERVQLWDVPVVKMSYSHSVTNDDLAFDDIEKAYERIYE